VKAARGTEMLDGEMACKLTTRREDNVNSKFDVIIVGRSTSARHHDTARRQDEELQRTR